MIDHVLLEVADLDRSGRFYDAVFFALGGRRMEPGEGDVAWGVDQAVFEIAAGAGAAAFAGHVALRAVGKAAVDAAYEAGLGAGGAAEAPPQGRPRLGPRGYGATLRDPDGHRIELVGR